MRISPIYCECTSCECAIYTYEDSCVCKACAEGNHLSGAKKKDYSQNTEEKQSDMMK